VNNVLWTAKNDKFNKKLKILKFTDLQFDQRFCSRITMIAGIHQLNRDCCIQKQNADDNEELFAKIERPSLKKSFPTENK
jgi:hypothetical protein